MAIPAVRITDGAFFVTLTDLFHLAFLQQNTRRTIAQPWRFWHLLCDSHNSQRDHFALAWQTGRCDARGKAGLGGADVTIWRSIIL